MHHKNSVYRALNHYENKKCDLKPTYLPTQTYLIGSIIVKGLMSIVLAGLTKLLIPQFGFSSDKGCNNGLYHQTSS